MNTTKLSPRPVQFKFSEYISQGFDLFKANIGTFILSMFAISIMGIIPLCGILGLGNFYKLCRKLHRGEPTSVAEIFSFKDFKKFLPIYLIIVAFSLILQIPNIVLILTTSDNEPPQNPWVILQPIFTLIGLVIYYYIIIKAYYLIPLMALENISSISEAWRLSKIMTKDNALSIIAFLITCGLISLLGFLGFIIGLILSIPLSYAIQYISFEDGIQQTKIKNII